jgi:large subunit ribosomal protein L24
MKLRVNDKVKVIAGKAKGTETTITKIQGDRVFLAEGITVKKHVKPTQMNPEGGIIEIPGSVHISNVQHVNGRLGYNMDAKGKKARIAKKTGKAVK